MSHDCHDEDEDVEKSPEEIQLEADAKATSLSHIHITSKGLLKHAIASVVQLMFECVQESKDLVTNLVNLDLASQSLFLYIVLAIACVLSWSDLKAEIRAIELDMALIDLRRELQAGRYEKSAHYVKCFWFMFVCVLDVEMMRLKSSPKLLRLLFAAAHNHTGTGGTTGEMGGIWYLCGLFD